MTVGDLRSALLGLGDDAEKNAVWAKGRMLPGLLAHDPDEWRQDEFGLTMRYSDYGNRSSEYGWEKDHIVPRALGGGDEIGNLRPLNYRANASLGGLLGRLLD